MRFQHFSLVLLMIVIPILLLGMYLGFLYKRRQLRRFVSSVLWEQMIPSLSYGRRFWKRFIVLLSLVGVILCLMRPQFGLKYERVTRRGQDILFVVDTSLSMQAEDVAPSRLDRAKQEIRALIDELKGDRVGILAFAGSAFMHVPLTLDYSAVKLFLEDIRIGMIPTPGSNLAQAIKVCRQSFGDQRSKARVMIIFTDGEFFEYDPVESAAIAKKLGVKIYTVGIGTKNGEPIPIRDESGNVIGYKKDKNDDVVLSRLNESILRGVAKETNARYYFSGKDGLVADEIYRDISQNVKKKLEEKQLRKYMDRYQWVLILVFLLLLLDFTIQERRVKPLEWKGRIR